MKRRARTILASGMALDNLQEASEAVWELERQLAEARAARDDLIIDAVYAEVAISRLSRITKLSRQYIYRLAPIKLADEE